jgi:hypothetical protein
MGQPGNPAQDPTRLEPAPDKDLCRVAGCAGFFASRMRVCARARTANIDRASVYKPGTPGNVAQNKAGRGFPLCRVVCRVAG